MDYEELKRVSNERLIMEQIKDGKTLAEAVALICNDIRDIPKKDLSNDEKAYIDKRLSELYKIYKDSAFKSIEALPKEEDYRFDFIYRDALREFKHKVEQLMEMCSNHKHSSEELRMIVGNIVGSRGEEREKRENEFYEVLKELSRLPFDPEDGPAADELIDKCLEMLDKADEALKAAEAAKKAKAAEEAKQQAQPGSDE